MKMIPAIAAITLVCLVTLTAKDLSDELALPANIKL